MELLLLLAILVLNFFISWSNAKSVGRYWSESKEVGGSFRVSVIIGYIMAIAGFTMVYGYILLLIAPPLLQNFNVLTAEQSLVFAQLAADLIYLFTVITIVPTGFWIWFNSMKNFWENKTLSNGLTAGYNTYAQLHNTISAARNAPSALKRVTNTLFDDDDDSEGKIAILAILIVVLAILSGYFTASAIMKKADREYDLFDKLHSSHPEAF